MRHLCVSAVVLMALLASSAPAAAQTGLPPNFSALMEQQLAADLKKLEVGVRIENTIKENRDRQIEKWDKLRRSGTISQQAYEQRVDFVQKNYQKKSRQIAASHRQPVIDTLRVMHPGLEASVGTDLFVVDKKTGALMLNPKHRGMQGDIDLRGPAKDVAAAQKTLQRAGLAVEATPGEVSAKGIETTINKDTLERTAQGKVAQQDKRIERLEKQLTANPPGERAAELDRELAAAKREKARLEAKVRTGGDSSSQPGSSAHLVKQQVDAGSKEVYQSVSMRQGQPGREAVEIQDHIKKAAGGLGKPPGALLGTDPDSTAAFQELAKGTLKTLDQPTAVDPKKTRLSSRELQEVLKASGLAWTPQEFRDKLAKFKEGMPAGALLDGKSVAAFQQASQRVLEKVESKTLAKAAREVETFKARAEAAAARIDQKIAAAATPAEKAKLRVTKEKLLGLAVDSKVKLQTAIAANKQRLADAGVVRLSPHPAVGNPLLTAPSSPSAKPSAAAAATPIAAAAGPIATAAGTVAVGGAKALEKVDALLTGGAQQVGALLALHGLVTTTLARAEQFADEPYALEQTVAATLADLSNVTGVVTTYATEFEKAGQASAAAEQKHGASTVRDGVLVMAATVVGTSKLAYNATIGGAWEAGKNVGTAVAEYRKLSDAMAEQAQSEARLEQHKQDPRFVQALKIGENRALLAHDTSVAALQQIRALVRQTDAGQAAGSDEAATSLRAFLSEDIVVPAGTAERWKTARELTAQIRRELDAVDRAGGAVDKDGNHMLPDYYDRLLARLDRLTQAVVVAKRFAAENRTDEKLSGGPLLGNANTGALLRGELQAMSREIDNLRLELKVARWDAENELEAILAEAADPEPAPESPEVPAGPPVGVAPLPAPEGPVPTGADDGVLLRGRAYTDGRTSLNLQSTGRLSNVVADMDIDGPRARVKFSGLTNVFSPGYRFTEVLSAEIDGAYYRDGHRIAASGTGAWKVRDDYMGKCRQTTTRCEGTFHVRVFGRFERHRFSGEYLMAGRWTIGSDEGGLRSFGVVPEKVPVDDGQRAAFDQAHAAWLAQLRAAGPENPDDVLQLMGN